MTCAAIMTADPVTLKESDSVAHAVDMLTQQGYLDLPVIDADGGFVGMFGMHDLMSLLVPRVALAGDLLPNLRFVGDDPAALRAKYQQVKHEPVGPSCDRQVVTLHPDTPEIEALRLFCRRNMSLPVIERKNKRLVGVVSPWDAIRAISLEAVPG